jgi:predicted TIM-barrel fold metal-dependent hydrolase
MIFLMLGAAVLARADELPIFDAHIHYSHDAWEVVSQKEAIAILRKAGLVRALVSSSNDDGTQMLYVEAPDLIVPELRPYRNRGETSTWVEDESVIAYVEERLRKYKYVAIGEFHVSGLEADLPVVRRIVVLAKQHGLILHAHSDADALERMFRQDPEARIIWAHAGFEEPHRVGEMMRRHGNLWADLALRGDVAPDGQLASEWREVFLEFPDRFMIGTDTFTPDRWNAVGSNAVWARGWLAELPPDVAERIAYKNGEEVLASEFSKRR